MPRTILSHGFAAGLIAIAGVVTLMILADEQNRQASFAMSYLVMLIGAVAIPLGLKRHRDRELGGRIALRTALLLGLGGALVAAAVYVAGWELYLAATDYAFMDRYIGRILEAQRGAGLDGEAYQALVTEMEAMRAQYANPLFRLPMTFTELFPVGLLTALVGALLLQNPRFLPPTATP
jgi:hypothetical protein